MLFSAARMYRRVIRRRIEEALHDAPPDMAMTELADATARALVESDAGASWLSRRVAVLFLARQILRQADAATAGDTQGLVPAND